MSEEWYRDRVVWGFYEEKTPEFYQGKDGENEICEPVSAKEVSLYVSRIEELDRACSEWAEVSQRNYQLAKRYHGALEHIAANNYGLQGIMEDYPDTDSVEYLEAALKYYTLLTNSYQKIAREAIASAGCFEEIQSILSEYEPEEE